MNDLAMIECDEIDDSADGEYTKRGSIVSQIIYILCGTYDADLINAD